jgi:hypothetical protein
VGAIVLGNLGSSGLLTILSGAMAAAMIALVLLRGHIAPPSDAPPSGCRERSGNEEQSA